MKGLKGLNSSEKNNENFKSVHLNISRRMFIINNIMASDGKKVIASLTESINYNLDVAPDFHVL